MGAEEEYLWSFWIGNDPGMRRMRPVVEAIEECYCHLDIAWRAIDVM